MINKYFALTLVSASLFAVGCSGGSDDDDDDGGAVGGGVVEPTEAVLPAGEDFDPAALEPPPTLNLLELTGAAGLSSLFSTISNDCPALAASLADPDTRVTVLAPTNAAFEEPGVVEALASPDIDVCTVLDSHIIPNTVASSVDLASQVGTVATSSAGTSIAIEQGATGALTVSGAEVIGPDNFAINGVAHVIDTVLAVGGSVTTFGPAIDAAFVNGNTSFVTAWDLDGQGTRLEDNTDTAFAPTNEAFDAAAPVNLQNLLVLGVRLTPADLQDLADEGGQITTNGGISYPVAEADGGLTVGGFPITVLLEGVSVIYSIDGVLQ